METIQHAAIRRSDGVVDIGKNHAIIINSAPWGTCKDRSTQGFLTSEGRFVNRHQAAAIARESGQLSEVIIRNCGLLSENFYADSGYGYSLEKGYFK